MEGDPAAWSGAHEPAASMDRLPRRLKQMRDTPCPFQHHHVSCIAIEGTQQLTGLE